MTTTRYKPLFSVSASYELATLGVITEGVGVEAVQISEERMSSLKLKPQYKKNTATIFYEGLETPANAPVTSEPILLIDTDQYFYFSLTIVDKERVKGMKFHSSPAIQKEIGFPLLYDASINILGGPTVMTAREDAKVISPVFTLAVTTAQAASTANSIALEIRDESNALVDLSIPPAFLNDKSIDGLGAVPEFSFSIDASSLLPGIYTFKVGAFQKKFFLATQMDITNSVSVIRVLKNNFLEYKKNLADNSFAQFSLQIPKV